MGIVNNALERRQMTAYTHEDFIAAIVNMVRDRLSDEDRAALDGVKICYGAGSRRTRGVTYYNAWKAGDDKKPLIEICAFAQRDRVQIAGTTIHEIGHVLAGFEAAHGKDWKAACARAGLRRVKAAGTNYVMAMIEPGLRQAIAALPDPNEGTPANGADGGDAAALLKMFRGTLGGCSAGVGSRGGTSRGVGSCARMVKMICTECGYVARASRKWIEALGAVHCPLHGQMAVEQAERKAADAAPCGCGSHH
jgi:hypothetical protein